MYADYLPQETITPDCMAGDDGSAFHDCDGTDAEYRQPFSRSVRSSRKGNMQDVHA